MKKLLLLLLLGFAPLLGQEPTPPADPSTDFGYKFILGSGAGFKPYQTTLKAGSSAFVEGGMQFPKGFLAFSRVEMRPTDAQMVLEACKLLVGRPYTGLMLCGGPGFGADANNVGIALAAGGKWFFSPSKIMQKQNVWVGLEMGVVKSTVPAPVSPDGVVVSPVQPDFRVGIFKTF